MSRKFMHLRMSEGEIEQAQKLLRSCAWLARKVHAFKASHLPMESWWREHYRNHSIIPWRGVTNKLGTFLSSSLGCDGNTQRHTMMNNSGKVYKYGEVSMEAGGEPRHSQPAFPGPCSVHSFEGFGGHGHTHACCLTGFPKQALPYPWSFALHINLWESIIDFGLMDSNINLYGVFSSELSELSVAIEVKLSCWEPTQMPAIALRIWNDNRCTDGPCPAWRARDSNCLSRYPGT